ncbi:MAG: hypothetical protein KGL10_03425 [Alphaproteobacteria bacterium]|nr:hypothetical protein [Alphaproteobacteria bacterium]
MRLKSFHAKSMSEAMRQVRDTLGEDAIIVSSKEEKSGWVKITAAVEQVNAPVEEEFFDAETNVERRKKPRNLVHCNTSMPSSSLGISSNFSC